MPKRNDREQLRIRRQRLFVAVALGMSILALTVVGLRQFERQEIEHLESLTGAALRGVRTQIAKEVDDRVAALTRMARHFEGEGPARRTEFEAEAATYVRDLEDFVAIEWVDADFFVRWVVPLAGNEKVLGLDLASEDRRREALERSRQTGRPIVSEPLELVQGGTGFLIFTPIEIDGEFLGFVLGVERLEPFFESILAPNRIAPGYAVRLSHEDELLFTRASYPAATPAPEAPVLHARLPVYGTAWTIDVQPETDTLAAMKSNSESLILAAGILAGLLIGISSYTLGSLRGRASEVLEARHAVETLFESSLDLMAVASLDGRFTKINPSWERVLGFSEDELTGQPFQNFVHPLDRERTQKELSVLARGGATVGFENRFRCKDGQYRWLRWSCPPPQPDAEVFYAVARDVTDEKMLEEFKDQFLATVSHELRTPLTAISGGLELVVSGECGPVSADQMEFLSASADSATRLCEIIDDLLDVESIASGRVSFDLDTVTPGEIVREVARTFRVQAAKKGLRLVVEVSATAEMTGDKQRLIQAVSNLVSNSIKYTMQGEVRLEAGRRGNDVEISVSDTGIGMSEDDQQQLFRRFFRAADERVQMTSGTGLGLVIVREIVERHGGRVEFDSRKGFGTEVKCVLPAVRQNAAEKEGVHERAREPALA